MLLDVERICPDPNGNGSILLGGGFTVFITGGDAGLVADVVPDARIVPDLVFVGLAMACPLS